MFTAKPLMLLTSKLRLGVFDFGKKKKIPEKFYISSRFSQKMRPNYRFETKKPTKSVSYGKSTENSLWSQNGTGYKIRNEK